MQKRAIRNQSPPVSRIGLSQLKEANVDWAALQENKTGAAARGAQKNIRPHQQAALEATHRHFAQAERGKLIMACGTGKTFTALRIAEHETRGNGLVLFLVPSIALLGQTLREWSNEAAEPIHAICVCSDAKVTRRRTSKSDANDADDGFSTIDLGSPATTDVKSVVRQLRAQALRAQSTGLTVVFSTYQSIEVIAQAQAELRTQPDGARFGAFDLIICDEAHRTTGVTLSGDDESTFVRVHDNAFLHATKRLYMTATPRLYSDDTKVKAAQADAVLCSMDDANLYGAEMYRIGFGEAVEKDLLTDYKVIILTMSDADVPAAVQAAIADEHQEINTDDASKLIGCINALSKQILGDAGVLSQSDPEPMRRAVAFCQSIKASEKITRQFNDTSALYLDALPDAKRDALVAVQSKHVDGTMSALERDDLLSWLKEEPQYQTRSCRMLTNARCLSEGVDVPSLDAVLFLSARNSQVDVVQSVGRVMRRAPGKKYGYIIIPVIIPSDVTPEVALNDNERFKVVWTVLNALRAHDDRFNATINKIELNHKKPDQILVGGPMPSNGDGDGGANGDADRGATGDAGDAGANAASQRLSQQLTLRFEQLQGAIFAKMVQRVGDRRYWEQWAKDVAQIAEQHIERIQRLVGANGGTGAHQHAFAAFLGGLRHNINPSISADEAIEMLAQHLITKPVFDALFEGYSFVQHNAVSQAMQGNPPYSVGQRSANDNAQNQAYPKLDGRIEETYVAQSNAGLNKSSYDAYIRAFRWASDRIDPQHGGIVAFVSNGAWLDSNSADGFRKCLQREFSAIYVLNLRGNQRTSGELSRKEGGKIFGSGSRTPIAITLLVKKPDHAGAAQIYYHDIGDYRSREEKLQILSRAGSVAQVQLHHLQPNSHGDWISQRNDLFETFVPIESEKKYDINTKSCFVTNSLGIASNRDIWCFNSNRTSLQSNIKKSIDFYNDQAIAFQAVKKKKPQARVEDVVSYDATKGNWTDLWLRDASKGLHYEFVAQAIVPSLYRPFFKQHLYFRPELIHRVYQIPKLFPTPEQHNRVICVSGVGASKSLSVLMADCIPDLHFNGDTQCFPLYHYERQEKQAPSLFESIEGGEAAGDYVRRDGVSDWILAQARQRYGNRVSKEDIFYYVYGFLHAPAYRQRFAADLKKMLPRIPLVDNKKDFNAFSQAGKFLADLHVGYESVPPPLPEYGVRVLGRESGQFRVEQMRFAKGADKKDDKRVIIYNSHIRIEGIPAAAYDYIVNGKSAIEWLMERYAPSTHKDSGIHNDPNDWAAEVNKPSYILDLLLSVIHLSLKTVEMVRGLPEVRFGDEAQGR